MTVLLRILPLTLGFALTSPAFPPSVLAQIIPDTTLPNDSVMNSVGTTQAISGGTTVGSNLFHSFREFNVGTGETARFENAAAIANIITRVTGGNASAIDGRIQANGTANLFLINPSGILFGPNARLEIGGSFLGTTAAELQFEDGQIYSAIEPDSPLLTVTAPVGLGFGPAPGPVVNRSQATVTAADGTAIPVGLQVLPGRTLALVGGAVQLEGGQLSSAGGRIDLAGVGATLIDKDGTPFIDQQTSGGRIEVGAVGPNSQVRLSQAEDGYTLRLGYEGIGTFEDITLSQQAVIDASGNGGGEIQVQGRRVVLQEGSQIRSNTLGPNAGGTLTINASEAVEVLGNLATDSPLDVRLGAAGILIPQKTSISTSSFAAGQAGDLVINTGSLTVSDGAEIVGFSFGPGRGGNVQITATGAVEVFGQTTLLGLDPDLFFPFGFDVPGYSPEFFREASIVSFISAASVGNGPAGSVSVSADRVTIRNGGLIGANAFFSGDGGQVTVAASDTLEVFGATANGIVRSRIANSVFGSGDAGDVVIETGRLIIRDGGTVTASTLGTGQAGDVVIQASERVRVSGSSPDGQFRSSLDATSYGPSDAGDLTIQTDQLIVQDGAIVAVNSSGSGNAGDLEIAARSVRLEDEAVITAATAAGQGGNISLAVQQTLQMRNDSLISTEAGTAQTGGDGGNIRIEADFVLGAPNTNSDIVANAFAGNGGNIDIVTNGLFGLAVENTNTPRTDPRNNITASSQFGVSGTLNIVIDLDLSQERTELPSNVVDSARLIAQNLCRVSQGSSFTVVGEGGVPPSPRQTLSPTVAWEDWGEFSGGSDTVAEPVSPVSVSHRAIASPQPAQTPVEAQGWLKDADGRLVLVAQSVPLTPYPMAWGAANCQQLQQTLFDD